MAVYLLKTFGDSVAKCLKRVPNRNGFKTRANLYSPPNDCKTICPERPAYITRLALPPDYDDVVEFMCEAYFKHEPTITGSGLSEMEPPLVWRKMMDDQVRYGMSIIAEDRDHCIIGAALNSPTTYQGVQGMYDLAKCCKDEPMNKVIEFYAYVTEKPKLWERYCVHTIFEQSSLAVSVDFRGVGIATRLVQESWCLARDCGYRVFRMDCNSSFCSNICQGFGFEQVWCIPFSQYVNNGEVIFKTVKEPHTVCRVFVDLLRRCKTYCPPYKRCEKRTPPPT